MVHKSQNKRDIYMALNQLDGQVSMEWEYARNIQTMKDIVHMNVVSFKTLNRDIRF